MKKFLVKSIAFISGCLLLGILSAFFGFVFIRGRQSQAPGETVAQERVIKAAVVQVTQEDEAPAPTPTPEKSVNILFIGLDEAQEADRITLLFFFPEEKRASVLQIPRDTYYQATGGSKKNVDKVKELYGAYGANGMTSAVSQMLGGITIDHHITVDTQGFAAIVDLLEGVPVNIPKDMFYVDNLENPSLKIEFKQGNYPLKGQDAIKYLSYIKGTGEEFLDRGDDLGRLAAAKEFYLSAFDRAVEKKLPVVANEAYQKVKGTLTLGEVSKLSTEALGMTRENITFHLLPGYMTPETYYVIDDAALKGLWNQLQVSIPSE